MKKVNFLERVKFNNYAIFLSCCLILLYALFFPALENPDEVEHLSRILYEKTLWGEIFHYIGSIFFDINNLSFIDRLVVNSNFSYVNNDFLYLLVNAPIEYYILKFINAFIVLIFFFLIVKIFNGNKLVLLWPSVTYYMSIFTSEGLAYALMLGVATNTKMKIFLGLCICVFLMFLDRSIVLFFAFLLMKFFIAIISRGNLFLMKKYSIYLLLISIVIYIFSIIDFNYILALIPFNEISWIAIYSQNLNFNHANQIIVFIMSFIMLSGSASFYPIILFHIYISYMLYNTFKHVKYRAGYTEINSHICSIFIGLSVFFIVSSIAPQLSHFRYYLFLIPPVVSLFTYKYSSKYLFLLTLIGASYNILGLNLMMGL